ncbi:ATP-binding protein [Jiangella ureilytica]|uniref:ATP-binding protein n=1 Tax=Jiangella ureilytica TaxID=2530374 RepID=A0A4R4RR10_9ACTN|nr:ATP-binding protein [Jiangella ureilytica]TDC52004.1 ATP-binding protein [Jiangella ureilytica]
MDQGWDIAEPRADALIESLRAFGYSPEAAVADLIDNSISAGAKRVSVDFIWIGRDSLVRVSDDGHGMTEAALAAAMRPGSANPLEVRRATDLGRFGLGLKTASFSQARELTVVSTDAATGVTSTRRWDLDTVAVSSEWRLLRTAPEGCEIAAPASSGGTVVQWGKLDRLVGNADIDDPRAQRRLLDVATRVQRHLAVTFHRFLGGRGRIRIDINGREIQPLDPFLIDHPATQRLESEELPFRGSLIRVTPYVLPHRSKLDDEDAERGGGVHGWNQQQGFYVYRSKRLLVPGDWLGLGMARDEHTKLARIAIDFPSSMDHEWQVDVKKSTARPPSELTESLRRIARATRSKAEDVYRHRGKIFVRQNSRDFVFAWHEYRGRNGELKYKVNRRHPVITALFEAAGQNRQIVERALRFIEETVPTTMIGAAVASAIDNQSTPFSEARRELGALVDFAFSGLLSDGASPSEAIDRIAVIEPFVYFPEVIAAFREGKL